MYTLNQLTHFFISNVFGLHQLWHHRFELLTNRYHTVEKIETTGAAD